ARWGVAVLPRTPNCAVAQGPRNAPSPTTTGRMRGRKLHDFVVGTPLALPAKLAERYPELRGVNWRRGGLPPRVGGWFLGARTVAAITLWRTVWLAKRTHPSEELLLHEFCHVEQFQAVSVFPMRYVWESLRRGYLANRFEVEARQYASSRTLPPVCPPPREDVQSG
ncbi:MAG: hypothetical protein ABI877_18940, partial [Gemmatimonadaceae bacterium]